MITGEGRIKRLRWLCRRGMKELNVLLEAFLLREHEALAGGAWPEFEALLGHEDDVLWDGLRGQGGGVARTYRDLIEAISSRTG